MGLCFYRTATLPSAAVPGWKTSPYPLTQNRLLSIVRARGTSWRKPNANVKILTLSHPRIVKADLESVLDNLLSDIVWGQDFAVKNEVRYNRDLDGYRADCRLIDIEFEVGAADVAHRAEETIPWPTPLKNLIPKAFIPAPDPLPPLESRRIAIFTMTWHTRCGPVLHDRCYNDHIYIAVAGPDDKEHVVQELPKHIEYE